MANSKRLNIYFPKKQVLLIFVVGMAVFFAVKLGKQAFHKLFESTECNKTTDVAWKYP